jgi:hypothetical protein
LFYTSIFLHLLIYNNDCAVGTTILLFLSMRRQGTKLSVLFHLPLPQ